MTPETFVEKFDELIDAPGAVAKMRELVLESAIEGKLVEPRDEDGDAAQLLIAISEERKDAALTMRIPLEPEASNDDHPFQIPANWEWTRLGNIAVQIQYGYTASADPNATEIRMLRITDIQNNRVDWPTVPGCDIQPGEAKKYLLAPNDILIARTGGTIGKSFIVPDAPVKSVFASYLIRVTPPQSMVARYLKIVLESPLYWRQLRAMSAGTGQPNINGRALGRLAIPVPPLAEQKRIVAKVDELLALCDRLEAQQEERKARQTEIARASLARFADGPTSANLDFLFHDSYDIASADLRKLILTLAVRGKLIPQDPDDDPPEANFPKLALAASQPADDGFPSRWLRVPLGAVGEWRGGGTPSKSRSDFWTGDIPWVSPKDMKLLHISDAQDHISIMAVQSSSVRMIPPGSLLMVVRGMILARTFPVALTTREVTINQDMKALIPFESRIKDFLLVALRALESEVLAGIERSSHGTCRLETDYLHNLTVAFPPLAEQHRIVAKVEELMSSVDLLEARTSASYEIGVNLLEAVVAELVA